MLVDHLGYRVPQQHHVLIERLDLALEFDSIHKVDRYGDMFLAQRIEERIL